MRHFILVLSLFSAHSAWAQGVAPFKTPGIEGTFALDAQQGLPTKVLFHLQKCAKNTCEMHYEYNNYHYCSFKQRLTFSDDFKRGIYKHEECVFEVVIESENSIKLLLDDHQSISCREHFMCGARASIIADVYKRLTPEHEPKPSFDCRRARSKYETAVCADFELAELDSTLNRHYTDMKRRAHAEERGVTQAIYQKMTTLKRHCAAEIEQTDYEDCLASGLRQIISEASSATQCLSHENLSHTSANGKTSEIAFPELYQAAKAFESDKATADSVVKEHISEMFLNRLSPAMQSAFTRESIWCDEISLAVSETQSVIIYRNTCPGAVFLINIQSDGKIWTLEEDQEKSKNLILTTNEYSVDIDVNVARKILGDQVEFSDYTIERHFGYPEYKADYIYTGKEIANNDCRSMHYLTMKSCAVALEKFAVNSKSREQSEMYHRCEIAPSDAGGNKDKTTPTQSTSAQRSLAPQTTTAESTTSTLTPRRFFAHPTLPLIVALIWVLGLPFWAKYAPRKHLWVITGPYSAAVAFASIPLHFAFPFGLLAGAVYYGLIMAYWVRANRISALVAIIYVIAQSFLSMVVFYAGAEYVIKYIHSFG